jgi:hypothetical protein
MKSKQQALQEYLEMGVKKADVAENVFGAIDERRFVEHYAEMDQAILKALKGEKTMIQGDPEIIHSRFMSGLNIYMGGYRSVIDEIQACNNGKTYGKIFPFGENHLVVLAKKSSKKHGVQKGMMMFRFVDSSEGTMVIKENRAFKEFESESVYDSMMSMGIDTMRMMGDSFLVEHSN